MHVSRTSGGLVANSGIGHTTGGTGSLFRLYEPPGDRNRPVAAGSARTPSRRRQSRTLSATTAWPRIPEWCVVPCGRQLSTSLKQLPYMVELADLSGIVLQNVAIASSST